MTEPCQLNTLSSYDEQKKIQCKEWCFSEEGNKEVLIPLNGRIGGFSKPLKVTDCRFAWIVLMAMVLSNVMTSGYIKSFGMTHNTVLEKFPETSSSMAGLMMSLLAGCRSAFAPMVGMISRLIGIRSTMFLGTLMCCTGLLASYFCTSILQLSVTLGAMMGIGMCMIEAIQVVVISNYFDDKLSTANGIRVAGNPIGGILYPIIIVLLLEFYGSTLMRLLMSGLFLNILVCAALMRPIQMHQRIVSLEIVKKCCDSSVNNEQKRKFYKALMSTFQTVDRQSKKHSDFQFFLNPVYLLFILMSALISLALPFYMYYLPIYGRSIGLTTSEISILLSVQSLEDLFFRLIIGWITDRNLCKKLHGFIISLIIGGTGVLLVSLCRDVFSILCSTTLFTIGSASYFAFINVILTDQFGKKSISTTWGFVRMVQGVCGFINPIVLGYMVDASGGYEVPFLVMGSGMMLSGLLLLLEPVVIRLTNSDVIIT